MKEGLPPARFRPTAEKARQVVSEEHGLGLKAVLLLAPRSIHKTTSGKIARAWCRRAFEAHTLDVLFSLDSSASPEALQEERVGYSPLERTDKDMEEVQGDGAAVEESLEKALLQVAAQGPSELSEPLDRTASLVSLGLDSMTIVQFKGVLENRSLNHYYTIYLLLSNKHY